jgi:hypothetical protein
MLPNLESAPAFNAVRLLLHESVLSINYVYSWKFLWRRVCLFCLPNLERILYQYCGAVLLGCCPTWKDKKNVKKNPKNRRLSTCM